MIQIRKKLQSGFTLLELLVVISIIGILLAVAGVAFSSAQQQGRDSRRVSDMQAVQKAFEQYYSQNGTYSATCTTMVTGGGLSVQPLDPVNTGLYSYNYTCTASTYCVCAYLNGSTRGNSTSNACAFSNTGTRQYFCVRNLQ